MNEYRLINQNNRNWDGSPTGLNKGEGVQLPQTPNGSLILTFYNVSDQNQEGTVSLTTGGSKPEFVKVVAQMNAPQIQIRDFQGENLSITNVSKTDDTTIWVEAWGPGFGSSSPLPSDGKWHPLAVAASCTTKSATHYQQLALRALKDYTVFCVFAGTDPKVYCVNAPDLSKVPGKDYTEVISQNTKSLEENWLGETLWVVNLSPDTAKGAQVALTDL